MNILVLVYVTDENDNAPIIMEKPLRALASINAQHGEVVRQVCTLNLVNTAFIICFYFSICKFQ